MDTLKLDVRGMTCGGCSARVQHVLGRLEGVGQIDVQLPPGSLTVVVDPTRVTLAQIEAAIAKVGFYATLSTTGNAPQPAHEAAR